MICLCKAKINSKKSIYLHLYEHTLNCLHKKIVLFVYNLRIIYIHILECFVTNLWPYCIEGLKLSHTEYVHNFQKLFQYIEYIYKIFTIYTECKGFEY